MIPKNAPVGTIVVYIPPKTKARLAVTTSEPWTTGPVDRNVDLDIQPDARGRYVFVMDCEGDLDALSTSVLYSKKIVNSDTCRQSKWKRGG